MEELKIHKRRDYEELGARRFIKHVVEMKTSKGGYNRKLFEYHLRTCELHSPHTALTRLISYCFLGNNQPDLDL